jgi:predicted transglutaminase-like cysteine proteinase
MKTTVRLRFFTRRRRILSAAPLALGLLAAPAGPAAAGLFGSHEVARTGALEIFTKYSDVLARYDRERAVVPPPCRGDGFDACQYPDWDAFLERTRALDPRAQLEAVARYVDHHPYIEDQPNWGVSDYWATPGQFLSRHGDCEDFAIAKYESLRRLGWPADALRLVYVHDTNLNIGHMVLSAELDGAAYILDNQAPNQVIADDRIRHYRPVYSLSGDRWWRHTPTPP